jgi:hypothetical protein
MGILVENDDLSQPEWTGFINGTPTLSGTGIVTINCVSYLGYLALRYLPDVDSATKDEAEWFDFLLTQMNTAHPGMYIEGDFYATGTPRTLSYLRSEWKTVLDAYNEIASMEGGLEYRLDVEWANTGRTSIRKVIRNGLPTIGTVSTNPEHVLEYPGSIDSYELDKDYTAGKFATHFVVTGDGSGAKQVMSNPVISPKESTDGVNGFPRVEVKEHVSGIEYTIDATALAESYSESYFSPYTAVKVNLSPEYDASRIKLGDSVRISIDGPEHFVIEEVWRVSGRSTSSDGKVSPTLTPMTDRTKRWPLIPGDPTNPSRELNESIGATDTSNPFSQGGTVLGPDGSSLVFDSSGITAFDSEGIPTSIYDMETGEIGDGSIGGVDMGTLSSFYGESGDVRIENGDSISVLNWTGLEDLNVGDLVSWMKNKQGGYSMLTRISKLSYDGAGLGYGRLLVDTPPLSPDNEQGTIVVLRSGGWDTWSPVTKTLFYVPMIGLPGTPVGTFFVHSGKVFQMTRWAGDDGVQLTRTYVRNPENGVWSEVDFTYGSVAIPLTLTRNEIFGPPRTIQLLPSTARLVDEGMLGKVVECMATIRTWNDTTSTWDFSEVTLTSGPYTYEGSGNDTLGPGGTASMKIEYSITGEGHMFVEVSATDSNGGLGTYKRGLMRFSEGDPFTIERVSSDGIAGYLGIVKGMLSDYTPSVPYDKIRLDAGGALYTSMASSVSWLQASIAVRELGSEEPEQILFSEGTYSAPTEKTAMGTSSVQRVGTSNTFIVASNIYADDINNPFRGAVIKVQDGTRSFLQEPGEVITAGFGVGHANIGRVTESEDGTILVVVDTVGTVAQHTENQKLTIYKP